MKTLTFQNKPIIYHSKFINTLAFLTLIAHSTSLIIKSYTNENISETLLVLRMTSAMLILIGISSKYTLELVVRYRNEKYKNIEFTNALIFLGVNLIIQFEIIIIEESIMDCLINFLMLSIFTLQFSQIYQQQTQKKVFSIVISILLIYFVIKFQIQKIVDFQLNILAIILEVVIVNYGQNIIDINSDENDKWMPNEQNEINNQPPQGKKSSQISFVNKKSKISSAAKPEESGNGDYNENYQMNEINESRKQLRSTIVRQQKELVQFKNVFNKTGVDLKYQWNAVALHDAMQLGTFLVSDSMSLAYHNQFATSFLDTNPQQLLQKFLSLASNNEQKVGQDHFQFETRNQNLGSTNQNITEILSFKILKQQMIPKQTERFDFQDNRLKQDTFSYFEFLQAIMARISQNTGIQITNNNENQEPQRSQDKQETLFQQKTDNANISEGYYQYCETGLYQCSMIYSKPKAVQIDVLNEQLEFDFIPLEIWTTPLTNEKEEVFYLIQFFPQWNENFEKRVQNTMKEKIKLFGSLTHEFRTPLNCSISMMEVLERHLQSNDPDLVDRFLMPALNSNKLLLNYINDMLDLVQMDEGKFQFTMIQFNLQELVLDCVIMVGMQARLKQLELLIEFDDFLPRVIRSDPNRIRQVILNFLSNALQFTQKGSITIRVIPKIAQLVQSTQPQPNIYSNKEETAKYIVEEFMFPGDHKISTPSTIQAFFRNKSQKNTTQKSPLIPQRLERIIEEQKDNMDGIKTLNSEKTNQNSKIPQSLIESKAEVKRMVTSESPLGHKKSRSHEENLKRFQMDESNSESFMNGTIFEDKQFIIEIQVIDTGIGISDKNINNIFTAFNKVDLGSNAAMNAQGCGLGLLISQSIARGLNPTISRGIEVTSEMGRGSKFSFFIEDHDQENTLSNQIMDNLIFDCENISEELADIDQKVNKHSMESRNWHNRQIEQDEQGKSLRTLSGISINITGNVPVNSNSSGSNGYSKMKQTNSYTSLYNISQQDSRSLSSYKSRKGKTNSIKSSSSERRGSSQMYKSDRTIPLSPVAQEDHFDFVRINTMKSVGFNSYMGRSDEEFSLDFLPQNQKSTIEFKDDIIKSLSNNSNALNVTLCSDHSRILIVDDNAFNTYALSSLLQNLDILADQAHGYEQARQLIEHQLECKICQLNNNQCYDLIFMDIQMPGLNGYESTQEIRKFIQENEINQRVIIIACTGYVGEEDKIKALKVGMDDFVTKPIMINTIQQIVKNWGFQIQ